MGVRRRAAFAWIAGLVAAFACSSYGEDEPPVASPVEDASTDGTSIDAPDGGSEASTQPRCVPQSLEPPPPDDPKCGTNTAFDLSSSDAHCGRCNHSCLGTGCVAGRCRIVDVGPLLSYDNGGGPTFVPLPLPDIHFGDALAVKRLAGDNASVIGDLVDAGNNVRRMSSLHSDGTDIVFTIAASGVFSVPVMGGPVTAVQRGVDAAHAVIAKGHVYFTENDGIHVSAPFGSSVFAPEERRPGGLATDGERIYWVTAAFEGTTLLKTSPAGTVATVQVQTLSTNAEGLFVDDGFLYWFGRTGNLNGAIFRSAVTGGDAPAAIASFPLGLETQLRALVVDATHVYWAMSPEGKVETVIYKAPKCGGPTTTIAGDLMPDQGMTFDDQFLYFAGERIRRLAK